MRHRTRVSLALSGSTVRYVVGTLFSIIVNVQKHTRCRYKKNAPDDGSKQLIRQMTKQDLQAETAWCVSELSYFTP